MRSDELRQRGRRRLVASAIQWELRQDHYHHQGREDGHSQGRRQVPLVRKRGDRCLVDRLPVAGRFGSWTDYGQLVV